MIFDWIFTAWIFLTTALLLILLGVIWDVRRRLLNLEKAKDVTINDVLRVIGPNSSINLRPREYTEEIKAMKTLDLKPKKGGWPKGKKRKKESSVDVN